jgi:adenylate kinase family enzyme
VGSCGSGKTTVAKRVARLLGTSSVHVDDYIWLPGWKLRERGQMLSLVEERLSGDDWVMEGNLGRDATRLWRIADRADLLIWLDLPLRVTFWRLVRRCLRRSLLRQTCCNGNRETLRQNFLSSKSILLYAWQTRRLRRVIYGKLLRTRPHVRLTSQEEVEGWLEALAIPLAGEGSPGRQTRE